MPGPLPDPRRRRRNAPTIPTTALPVSGRQGPVPKTPSWVKLDAAGRAWWRWVWATPQACGWGPGQEVLVARRASLEDDMATIAAVESLNLDDLIEDEDAAKRLRGIINGLAALATGRLAICREMRELDDRLGLSPKGLAALRWTIVPDPEAEDVATDDGAVDEVAQRRAERRKLVAG